MPNLFGKTRTCLPRKERRQPEWPVEKAEMRHSGKSWDKRTFFFFFLLYIYKRKVSGMEGEGHDCIRRLACLLVKYPTHLC